MYLIDLSERVGAFSFLRRPLKASIRVSSAGKWLESRVLLEEMIPRVVQRCMIPAYISGKIVLDKTRIVKMINTRELSGSGVLDSEDNMAIASVGAAVVGERRRREHPTSHGSGLYSTQTNHNVNIPEYASLTAHPAVIEFPSDTTDTNTPGHQVRSDDKGGLV